MGLRPFILSILILVGLAPISYLLPPGSPSDEMVIKGSPGAPATCGLATPVVRGIPQSNTSPMPAPNYTTFLPPAKGGTYIDQNFGCPITRLTDGPVDYGKGKAVHHFYSSMTAMNSNDTYVIVLRSDDEWYVIDISGRVIVQPGGAFGEVSGGGSPPLWSISEPKTLYWEAGNKLVKGVINSAKGTVTKTTLHSFTQYKNVYIGGPNSETDVSVDGDHLPVVGVDSSKNQWLFAYTISTDTVSAALNVGTRGYDYVTVAADNSIIINWGGSETTACSNECYKGQEIYDPMTMAYQRQIVAWDAHAARWRDLNGDSVIVTFTSGSADLPFPNGATDSFGTPCYPGIIKVRTTDGQQTCLMNYARWATRGSSLPMWNTDFHVSIGGGWALVNFLDTSHPGGTASYPLPANWQDLWILPYLNEVCLVRLDGSRIIRLADTRGTSTDYWKTPRASVSRDGKYLVFDSDYGIEMPAGIRANDYTDVYLIKIQ
jgi:hypothetical protein